MLTLANEFFSLASGRIIAGALGPACCRCRTTRCSPPSPPATPAQFAGNALKAAQVVQREFGALGERWQNEYGLPAAVALGVHVGETVFGMAGPQGAQQYVAFGDCVSIAERLVHRARAGEIVLSVDVMKALGAAVAHARRRGAAAARARQAAADPDLRHGAGNAPGLYLGSLELQRQLPRIACASDSADARPRRRPCARR